MLRIKYVTFEVENEFGVTYIAAVFSESIVHKAQAQSVVRSQRQEGNSVRIHGAGFLVLKDEKPRCYGWSESLGLGAAPEDSEIVRAMFHGEIPVLPCAGTPSEL